MQRKSVLQALRSVHACPKGQCMGRDCQINDAALLADFIGAVFRIQMVTNCHDGGDVAAPYAILAVLDHLEQVEQGIMQQDLNLLLQVIDKLASVSAMLDIDGKELSLSFILTQLYGPLAYIMNENNRDKSFSDIRSGVLNNLAEHCVKDKDKDKDNVEGRNVKVKLKKAVICQDIKRQLASSESSARGEIARAKMMLRMPFRKRHKWNMRWGAVIGAAAAVTLVTAAVVAVSVLSLGVVPAIGLTAAVAVPVMIGSGIAGGALIGAGIGAGVGAAVGKGQDVKLKRAVRRLDSEIQGIQPPHNDRDLEEGAAAATRTTTTTTVAVAAQQVIEGEPSWATPQQSSTTAGAIEAMRDDAATTTTTTRATPASQLVESDNEGNSSEKYGLFNARVAGLVPGGPQYEGDDGLPHLYSRRFT